MDHEGPLAGGPFSLLPALSRSAEHLRAETVCLEILAVQVPEKWAEAPNKTCGQS